jgi:hypothetical protein
MATNLGKQVKSFAAVALVCACYVGGGIATADAQTTTSVATSSCGWVDTSPPGLAWHHDRTYQCSTVTVTNDGSSASSSTRPVALSPNERFVTPEEQQQDNLRKAEARSHQWNPPEASLCPPPRRMTQDGCQAHPYRPHWLPTQ